MVMSEKRMEYNFTLFWQPTQICMKPKYQDYHQYAPPNPVDLRRCVPLSQASQQPREPTM